MVKLRRTPVIAQLYGGMGYVPLEHTDYVLFLDQEKQESINKYRDWELSHQHFRF